MKSVGELLFEAHATDLGLDPIYEPDSIQSKKRPDYWLRRVDVICEVEAFGMGTADRERERLLAANEIEAVSDNPWKRIRNLVERGSTQLKGFEGSWPLIIVLHCPPPVFVPLDTYMVLTALHGNERLDLDEETHEVKRSVFSPDHSVLRPDHKPYLSAISVIERFRPLEEEINEEVKRESDGRRPTHEEWNEIGAAAQSRVLSRYPGLATDHEVTRLRVMHNPFCLKNPLPLKVFTGAHDEQWQYDRRAERFVLAWKGPGLVSSAG